MVLVLKNISLKFILLLLAFQILNQSFDAIDFQPIYTANAIEDFNDINSATEYISEIILGNKDAFPEFETTNNSQNKAAQSLKHVNLKLFQPQTISFIPNTFVTVVSFAYPLDETYTFLFSKDINPPPPSA